MTAIVPTLARGVALETEASTLRIARAYAAGSAHLSLAWFRRERTAINRFAAECRAMEQLGPLLETKNVARHFGDRVAVAGVTARFEPGKIHALIGENGAGKSTVLKLLAGHWAPSSGTIHVGGVPLSPATPAEAQRRNVLMVHQHFMLVGAFTALENLLLGNEGVGAWQRLDFSKARREVKKLAEQTGLSVPLDTVVDGLGVGDKQRLEILRVLHRGAEAILLDEPTAVLAPLEANELYATLRTLAAAGKTVVVVTHRLDEVVRFADHVTVLRRGQLVLSEPIDRSKNAASVETLTRAIMGKEVPPTFAKPPVAKGASDALLASNFSYSDTSGRVWLSSVNLRIARGEIVGIAGVEGNGQRELVLALAGLIPEVRGTLRIAERAMLMGVDVARAVQSRRKFLRVVHEDRHAQGLLLEATVSENLTLGELSELTTKDEAEMAHRRLHSFGIYPADSAQTARELSGGNQQKIVVARALDPFLSGKLHDGGAVVLAQPTRGVDVGAQFAIFSQIGRAAEAGLGVLVVSADLNELRLLCHRLLVMHKGRIVGEFSPSDPEELIGRAMLGLREDEAA